MFSQRISPFVCIIIALIVCVTTFVGTASYTSKKEEAHLNELREEWAEYSKYSSLNGVSDDELDSIKKLVTLIETLERESIREYDDESIWTMIYKSLALGTNDIYGQYYTKEEYDEMTVSNSGFYVGIGVRVTYDEETEGAYIYNVISNSAAQAAGVQAGDIIIEAAGIKSSKDKYTEMTNAILGEEGTDVRIKVKRGEEIVDFTIYRAQVASENVLYEKLDGNIAYFRILTFSDRTLPSQFKDKLALAQEEGCESFIFDVRQNAGGLLDSITGVLDPILPEGPILHTIDKQGNTETTMSDAECFTAPMVVLCNKSTASAAELFVAALRDYKLATIVGETTYGKGSMQTTQPLTDGSAIKMTTSLYNPPCNESYDGIGIKPDYEVALDEKWQNKFFMMPKDEDAQLLKAISLLNSAE